MSYFTPRSVIPLLKSFRHLIFRKDFGHEPYTRGFPFSRHRNFYGLPHTLPTMGISSFRLMFLRLQRASYIDISIYIMHAVVSESLITNILSGVELPHSKSRIEVISFSYLSLEQKFDKI